MSELLGWIGWGVQTHIHALLFGLVAWAWGWGTLRQR